jgi:hypothetical protein
MARSREVNEADKAMQSLKWRGIVSWTDLVREHVGAGHLSLSKRLEGGAADLYSASALMDRAP